MLHHARRLFAVALAFVIPCAVSAAPLGLGNAYLISGGSLDQSSTGPDGGAFTGGSHTGFLLNLTQSVTLANPGDYIELNFSVESLATNNNNPWGFRMGIYDNGGAPASADGQSGVTENWEGYLAWYKTTASNPNESNNAVFAQGSGSSSGDFLGEGSGGGFGTSPSSLPADITKVGSNFNSTFQSGDAPFTATLRLERTASGLDIIALQDSSNGGTILRSTTTPVTTTFNAIGFAHSSSFEVDDIVVTSNIPEPSTLWLMGVMGVAATAVVRRRRS